MWVVVYVAPNRKVAGILKELLELEGIMVRLKGLSSQSEKEHTVAVMVSDLEIEEANEVITNVLQNF